MKKITFLVSLTLLVFVFCGITSIIEPFAEKQSTIGEQQDYPSKIAFMGSYNEIYVINADGTNLTRLTDDDDHWKASPSWSPDGSKIAFCAATDEIGDVWNWNMHIFIINADGSNRIKLTDDGYSVNPSWSPDGSKIAFMSHRNGYDAIFVMNSDGSNQTLIINGNGASWSPDCSKIVFAGEGGIWTMNADGTNQICITNNSLYYGYPAWSPDGSKIAFAACPDEPQAVTYIYVMNADGSNKTKINKGSRPEWSPDCSKIAFTRYSRIYIMNADGSNETKLTEKRCDSSISWSLFIH